MLQIDPTRVSSQAIGRLGELVVEMELLTRGWITGNFNAGITNAAGWDIFAAKESRSVKLRVKAKRPGVDALQWSAKKDGGVFLQLDADDPNDFVAAVNLMPGSWDVYLIPTRIVAAELAANHDAWMASPRRDGAPKALSNRRIIWLNDRPEAAIGHGYGRRWAGYRNAWQLLEP